MGQSSEIHWKGDAQPGFDGDVMGLQAGLDVGCGVDNHRNQIGVFVGRTRAQARPRVWHWAGRTQVGQNRLDDKHVGLYWTFTDSSGVTSTPWRCRAATTARVRSSRGLGFGLSGDGTSVSVEAGKPLLHFGQSAWWLEPQVQVIWQRTSLDDRRDEVSSVRFDNDNAWTGRIGLRLAGDYQLATTAGSRISSSITGMAVLVKTASVSTTT